MMQAQVKTDPQTHFILTGNLWRVLWRLAWPAVLGMLLFGLNGFIDALYVGQLLGETALAGVSLAVPLMQIQMGLCALVGTGAGAVLSLAIGANDVPTQRKLWGNMVLLSVVLALPATVLTALFAPQLIGWMGGTGEPLRLGTEFYRTYALGSLLTIFGIGGTMFIRGEGRLRESMLLSAIGLMANIALNPLFISTFEMGVSGAAWATITANGLMALGTLWYYGSGHASFAIDLSRYRLDADVAGSMAKVGFSSLIMSVMTVVQGLVVFNALARYGTERDMAFYGAANRILLLCMTPAFGLMRALQPVVGINYGAGQFDRVRGAYGRFTIIGTVLLGLFFVGMVLFSRQTLSALLPGVAFVAADITHFRILILPILVLSLVFTGLTLFQSVGNAKVAGGLAMGRQLVLFIPAVWYLGSRYGISGIYYAQTGVDLLVTLITVYFVWAEFRRMCVQATQPLQTILPA